MPVLPPTRPVVGSERTCDDVELFSGLDSPVATLG